MDHRAPCREHGVHATNPWIVRRPRRPARGGPVPHPGGTLVHPEPCRPGRIGTQDRASRHGRRHARLGPALRAGARWRDRVGLLPVLQPRQAVGGAGLHRAGLACLAAAPDPRCRRAGGKLQGRRAGAPRAGLRGAGRHQPRADLPVDHGLRPERPVCAQARLRLCVPGAGRPHGLHGRGRWRGGRGPAAHGRGRGGPDDGHVCHQRRAGGRGAAPAHGVRPAHRPGPAGRGRGHECQPGGQLPGQRREPAPHGQRPSQLRALRGVCLRRRPFHPGHRQ